MDTKLIQEQAASSVYLGIRGRLFIGFLMLVVPILIALIYLLIKISIIQDFSDRLVNINLPTQDASITLDTDIYATQLATYTWMLTADESAKHELTRSWADIRNYQGQMNSLVNSWDNNEYLQKWLALNQLYEPLKTLQDKLIANSADHATLNSLILTQANPLLDKMLSLVDGPITADGSRRGGMFDILDDELNQSAAYILHDIAFLRMLTITLLALILILSVSVPLITARNILKPLHNAIDIAKRIAAGERDVDINITTHDEAGQLLIALATMQQAIKLNDEKLRHNEASSRKLFENIAQTAKEFSAHSSKVAGGDLHGRLTIPNEESMQQLGKDLNSMTDSLTNVTQKIVETSHHMVGTLEEVRQAVNVQTTGATEQASSINQITASLEEIEKSSNQTMEKAKALGDAAERTRENGEQGLESVEQSIQGMRAVRDKVQIIAQTILDLSNQTQQVGDITNVVSTIAQQLKMLALNASIEAAKAGEVGKGFAVVAAEVKNLAEQSEQSTVQVQKILEDIRHATEKAVIVTEDGINGVDHGTVLIEQTGTIVRKLSDVIQETTIASEQIEAAVRQESIGIEQITAGMNEINQVTASFVSSANQTKDAIENLTTLTKNLKEYVDIYKI